MTAGPADMFLERFRAVVAGRPDAPAVVDAGRVALTYRQLDEAAQMIGDRLAGLGVGQEAVVGLGVEKSPAYVAAMLGTWAAGAAFLPLDPSLPRERVAFMVREAGGRIVVVQEGCEHRLDGLDVPFLPITPPHCHPERQRRTSLRTGKAFQDAPPVRTGLTANAPCPRHDPRSPEAGRAMDEGSFGVPQDDKRGQPSQGPDEPAYVIFTSGSTGTPKGVMVTHRGIVNLLDSQIDAFRLTPDSRCLFYLSTTFDAAISDIGTALLSGAALCIEPPATLRPGPAFARLLADRGISHVDLPPSLLPLLDPGDMPACLRTVVIGGEVCPPAVVRRWAAKVRLVNVYGPTEATVCTSLCACDPATWDEPSIGRPIPGVTYDVLEADLRPAADGTPGELFIGGVGLARGYVNRPDLTAARFVVRDGRRLYRTGDRVVRRADGEYVFLGRLDRQVKVRGQLVEPEEVEARLLRHPAVRRAAVVSRQIGPPTPLPRRGLVAFLVCGPAGRRDGPAVRDLREHVAARLPRWMVPQRFVFVDSLPATPTGKADTAALTACDLPELAAVVPEQADTPEAFDALPDEARVLADIWRRVLGVESVGPYDDFYQLGGDSLALLEIVTAAAARGIVVPPAMMTDRLTIADIVSWLRRPAGDAATAAAPPPGAMTCGELRKEGEFTPAGRVLLQSARERPVPDDLGGPPRAVLLTGATGFLGSRLLCELLDRTDARIYCLVRHADEPMAVARVRAAAASHGVSLDAAAIERIIPICGTLDIRRFGKSPGAWAKLADAVDAVYHCGAQVNLVQPYTMLRPANVKGTETVLRLACEGRPKRLHYASTLSVFVATDRSAGTFYESDELSDTRLVYGGYAQTKWAAEHLLRAGAREAGLAASVYRLGLITGDTTTGYAPPADQFGLFVRGLAALGCVPDAGAGTLDALRLDVTPVDYAAAAMASLSLARPSAATDECGADTFHIANPRSLSLAALVEAMNSFGLPVERVDPVEWRRRARIHGRHGQDTPASAAYLALCRCLPDGSAAYARLRTMDLFQATGVTFDVTNTRARLAASGLTCPPPDRRLLHTYLRALFPAG